MMLTTLDGASRGPDGRSGSLSSPFDQRVFSEVRRFAHAVLIGAGTMRAERYQPITARPDDVDARADLALPVAPVLVIVSRSLDLPWEDPVFGQSAITPIVVAPEGADAGSKDAAHRRCDLIELPGNDVDPLQLISALAYRGLLRIVCEGGPTLLSQLARASLIDEADITVAPVLATGGQICTGRGENENPAAMRLESLLEHEGWLFTRYLRATAEPPH